LQVSGNVVGPNGNVDAASVDIAAGCGKVHSVADVPALASNPFPLMPH
jgi:hypothetical protein